MNNIKIKNIINILFYCYFNRVYFLFNSYNFYKEKISFYKIYKLILDMADKVRVYIDQMKSELLYFIKKGVFTKEEAR